MNQKLTTLLAVIVLLTAPTVTMATTVSRQLIKDYSFEDNSGYWIGDGDWRDNYWDAKTGEWLASLWPDENDMVSVTQDVKIPKKTKTLQLSFWYDFSSLDYESVSDDWCSVEVGNEFYDYWEPGNDETLGWTKYVVQLPVKELKGKTVKVDFTCITDYSLDTWLDIDNVRLKAKVKK